MPLFREPLSAQDDPAGLTRWSYRDPLEEHLPNDDPTQPFCAIHSVTIAQLKRSSFGPHKLNPGLPRVRGLRDWNFGTVAACRARRSWCRACRLIDDALDPDWIEYWLTRDVKACWVWDGVLQDSRDTATLRLRISIEAHPPFDLVPLDLDEKALFSARPVAADHFDVGLARSWVRFCDDWHGRECLDTTPWQTTDHGAPFIRLISLDEDRLIETARPKPYAALSYVWGFSDVFKTRKSNVADLLLPGGTKPYAQAFPKSIDEAISLARSLDFHFLWVDSICIIQDSQEDKDQQLKLMGDIYTHASLTIVAAAGDSCNAGIPGLYPGSRAFPQPVARISDDLCLVPLRPDTECRLLSAVWNTRGWTYQERLLSSRCLFSLPDGSVSFQCSKAAWGEDYCAESPQLVSCAPMKAISLNESSLQPGGIRERLPPRVQTRRASYLQEYSRLIQDYTGRNMTYQSDRLVGVDGVLDVLRKAFSFKTLQGLPEPIFHFVLLWQPRNKINRVPADEVTGLPLFPSWSWAGWKGPVGYENWDETNGLPALEERARRIIPRVSITMKGSDTIKAFIPTKSRVDVPNGWSEVKSAADGVCYLRGTDNMRYHAVPLAAMPVTTPGTLGNVQVTGLRFRASISKFCLNDINRGPIPDDGRPPVETRGRFGLGPDSQDASWIGTIILPVVYHKWIGNAYDFILVSESYGFSRYEADSVVANTVPPYGVYDVMMIRRIEGEELQRYCRHFSAGDEKSYCQEIESGRSSVIILTPSRIMPSTFPASFVTPWRERLMSQQANDFPNYYVADCDALITTSVPRSLHVGIGFSLYKRAILSAILKSRHTVDFVTCYWAPSPTREAFRDALIRLAASRRQLDQGTPPLRITIGFSSMGLFQKLFHTSSRHGHSYPPSQWPKLGLPDEATLQAGGIEMTVKSLFFTPFSVMHPKYIIIDRVRAFLPSCNVSWERWFEACIEVEGDVMTPLLAFHHSVWQPGVDEVVGAQQSEASDEREESCPITEAEEESPTRSIQLSLPHPAPTILLPSPHHRNPRFSFFPFLSQSNPPTTPLNGALLTLFANAKREITMLSPNFTSWPVLDALLEALSRGIDVQIRTSKGMMLVEQLVTAGTTTSRCLRKFVKKYQGLQSVSQSFDLEAQPTSPGKLEILYYKPRTNRRGSDDEPQFSHFKMTLVDDEYLVLGSGNMDRASWWTSQELGILLRVPNFEGRALWDGALEGRTEVVYRSTDHPSSG
ncbi:hypothetical protein L249_0422 [Ophiocordyceps polyrhachis-furcata BCC 54312]|uniref:PLD phosphodiesterase domain-containing protein n=1 Tax=Ophiocordyceps polyrhachis-furcata BCC 54312 TaxID=1330021 RepID=A0A367LFF2_9HYPO|nr:hypothetical protein L249_0422 [Ophiocordyceps polyrhachis-furcata BCC 54312]